MVGDARPKNFGFFKKDMGHFIPFKKRYKWRCLVLEFIGLGFLFFFFTMMNASPGGLVKD